jgi:hypothetical protein
MLYYNLSSVSQNVLKFYQQLTGEEPVYPPTTSLRGVLLFTPYDFPRVTCAILAPNSGTESEILSRRTYQFAGIWQFYKYGWLMRISEIFLLENLNINVPYHRLTMTIVCLNFYSSNLSRFQYFDRKGNTHQGSFSKIRTLQLFSVGSCDEFYLNIASYVSCILRHFVLFCFPFSNKYCVIYISQSCMPN